MAQIKFNDSLVDVILADCNRDGIIGPLTFAFTGLGSVIQKAEIDLRQDKDGVSYKRFTTAGDTPSLTFTDTTVVLPSSLLDVPSGAYFMDVKLYLANAPTLGDIYLKCGINILGVATYG